MKILEWFRGANKEAQNTSNTKGLEVFFSDYECNVAFKSFGIQLCINRLANAITKCDFETYKDRKIIEQEMYYLFNVEPNINQNPSKFWNKLINKMVFDVNGALVFQSANGQLFVADSYSMSRNGTSENTYSDIRIDNKSINRILKEREVIHIELNNSKVKKLVDSIYSDYGQLIGGTIKNYNRSNALKFIMNLDSITDQWKTISEVDEDGNESTRFDNTLDDLFENRFKAFLSEKDSIMPLENGLDLKDMNSSSGSSSSGSNSNKTTRDITAIFDDIINMCADAFNIPRGFLKGDVADAEALTDNFIAFAVSPIAEQIQDEVNRKLYGKQSFLNGEKLKVNTERIRNYDVSKLATSAELLSRIGAYTMNDILRLLGKEIISEEWANMHIMSKNYSLVEQENLRGGDINENEED